MFARSLFQELIEINTTDSVGNVTTAAEAMAKRLCAAGYAESEMALPGPNVRKKNLVVRLLATAKCRMKPPIARACRRWPSNRRS